MNKPMLIWILFDSHINKWYNGKMKTCNTCKKQKDVSNFYTWTYKGKTRPRASCKSCQQKRCKVWHEENREAVRVRSKKNRDVRNDKARAYVTQYFTDNPCVDCGEGNLMKLEFDHLGDKEFTIAALLSQSASLLKIIKEVEKCDVVCANCHRVRTYTRNKSYRWEAEIKRNETNGIQRP